MKRLLSALVIFLLLAFTAKTQTTNSLSDAEIQGQQLAQELLQVTPSENLQQMGNLKVESSKGATTNSSVTFTTTVTNGFWSVNYLAQPAGNTNSWIGLTIGHHANLPNQYLYSPGLGDSVIMLDQAQTMAPFANSDFWICDLGLEFFHWPGQKVLKHETRRTRACTVLESTNPDPSPGGYSRVVTWIDDESLGIIWAEAYDANGKLLKEFDPKKIKKVNGQWELEDMEIRNVQTHSRTWIKFDVSDKS